MLKYATVAFAALSLAYSPALARHSYGGGRTHYSGSHHTTSHGGHFAGGSSGSSHRGGHYRSPTGGHRYGCHRC
jgi:hypothetical protein